MKNTLNPLPERIKKFNELLDAIEDGYISSFTINLFFNEIDKFSTHIKRRNVDYFIGLEGNCVKAFSYPEEFPLSIRISLDI